jgi:glycoside/pentoside/hexuronide:cation symporter, GPH family
VATHPSFEGDQLLMCAGYEWLINPASPERIFPDPKQSSSVRQDLSDLAHNGPWMAVFVLGVLIHIQLAMRSGALLYYFNCYSQFKNLFSWVDNFGLFNGVGLVFTMVGVGLAKPLVIRFGKKVAFRACLCLSSILLAGFALVPRDAFFELLTLQVLLQLVFGPTIPILWSMMADVADFSEWTSRRRSTGLAFASIIFGLKLGLGVGAWFNGQLLERLQYSATAAVSTSSLLAIRLMISVLPAAVLMIAVTVLAGYRLDDVLMKQIEDDLHARRVATGLAADIV